MLKIKVQKIVQDPSQNHFPLLLFARLFWIFQLLVVFVVGFVG